MPKNLHHLQAMPCPARVGEGMRTGRAVLGKVGREGVSKKVTCEQRHKSQGVKAGKVPRNHRL